MYAKHNVLYRLRCYFDDLYVGNCFVNSFCKHCKTSSYHLRSASCTNCAHSKIAQTKVNTM